MSDMAGTQPAEDYRCIFFMEMEVMVINGGNICHIEENQIII
jgi:hypothetical protein